MLTRRHLRVKVMQYIYAFEQSEKEAEKVNKKNMLSSIDDIYQLYILMLNMIVDVVEWDKNITEKKKKRALKKATQSELPNESLSKNKFAKKLIENISLQKNTENNQGLSWKNKDEYIQIILKEIKNSNIYANYIRKKDTKFGVDKNFIIDVFKTIIAPNEKIHSYIESDKLSWIADIAVANSMVLKTLSLIFEDSDENQHLMSLYKSEDDRDFAIELFGKTISNSAEYEKIISGKTPSWDADRIIQLDLILMKMAVNEFLNFPSIPAKVTINEYLEISKDFSTVNSRVFINGILDKLWKEFEEKKENLKNDRGLL